MLIQEEWERWEPVNGLEEKFYIDEVIDNYDGFCVKLSNEDNLKKIKIFFEAIGAYRYCDETYRIETFANLSEKYKGNFYGNCTFFKVKNSEYLQFLSNESCTISDYHELKHYSLIAANSVLDIVSSLEPKVEFID